MGTIICEKHGMNGVAINIQKDICIKIRHNEILRDGDLEVIKVKLYDNNQFLLDINYIVTKAMKKELMLLDVYEIREEYEDEKLIKLPFESKISVMCVQCLNEYKYKKNIKSTLEKYMNHI